MGVHDIPLRHTNMHPLCNVRAMLSLAWLMFRVRPDRVMGWSLSYLAGSRSGPVRIDHRAEVCFL